MVSAEADSVTLQPRIHSLPEPAESPLPIRCNRLVFPWMHAAVTPSMGTWPFLDTAQVRLRVPLRTG
jgi:hypothetical protein